MNSRTCVDCSTPLTLYSSRYICDVCCVEQEKELFEPAVCEKEDGSNLNANYGYWDNDNKINSIGIIGGYGSFANNMKFLNKWHRDPKEKKIQNAHAEFNSFTHQIPVSQIILDIACEYFIKAHKMEENNSVISRSKPRLHLQLACIYLALSQQISITTEQFYRLILSSKIQINIQMFLSKYEWIKNQL